MHPLLYTLIMDMLEITPKGQTVMFSIRIDESLRDYYEKLAAETNRSRNEVIAIALDFAKDKIKIVKKPE